MIKRAWPCLILLLLPLAGNAANDLKAKAEAAWAMRGDVHQALLAVDYYEQLAKMDPADFDSRLRLARAVYWVLEELKADLNKNKKIEMYNQAIKGCNEIIGKDEDNVAAWYWLLWDMGALTLVKGVFSGWNLREAIVGTIMVAKADVNYGDGGVYRYWGRVIYETPGIMGRFLHFSDEDSVWLYQRSIAVEPRYLRTHFFLAQTYEKLGREHEAVKEYRFCVDQRDDALPGMGPENRLYKKMAAQRLKKM